MTRVPYATYQERKEAEELLTKKDLLKKNVIGSSLQNMFKHH